jgi:hypothetical protein
VTAASAAMALVLGLALGGTGIRQVHVNEASWSVNTNQDGTVTLQVRRAADPVRLEAVLSQAGVPAKVSWGESCGAVEQVAPLQGFVYGSAPSPKTAHNRGVVSIGWTVTFKPGQRPSNTIYYLGSRTGKAGHANVLRILVSVVPNTLHLACTKGPHAISSPHATAAGSPQPTATPRPHPSCSPRPFASPSPLGSPSPSGSSSPYESPSPRGAPASSPAAG